MKKLLLIRHAEAVPHAEGGDFTRPLSARGEKDALKTAAYLQQHGLQPENIVASAALRTTTTARIIAGHLQIPEPAFTETIYEASEKTLLKVIHSWDDNLKFAALVGHNPGIAYLAYHLSNELRDIPPGTALLLTFEVDNWAHLSDGLSTITHYFAP